METKICNKCKRELPVDEFYLRNKNTNKRVAVCKECRRKQQAKYDGNKGCKKSYDLVNPTTLEIVETISEKNLLKRLGVIRLNNIEQVDGLLITERE